MPCDASATVISDYVVLSDAHVRGTLRVRRSGQSQVLAHFDIGEIRLVIHDHPSHVVGSRLAVHIVFFPTPGSLPTSIGEASSDNEGGVKKTKWVAIYVTQDFERFCESRMRSISD